MAQIECLRISDGADSTSVASRTGIQIGTLFGRRPVDQSAVDAFCDLVTRLGTALAKEVALTEEGNPNNVVIYSDPVRVTTTAITD